MLKVENHRQDRRHATYRPELAPFSEHRLRVRDLVADAVDFAEGEPLSVSGRHTATGLYLRPYVVTTDASNSAYHGGDRYPDMTPSPAHEHRFLDRGRVNPFFAIHSPELTTTINLFNSHGAIEDDFWVDLYLYDEAGTLVAERSRWRLARRGTLTRGHLVDILPPDQEALVGHIVLAFTNDGKAAYPPVLQALWSTALRSAPRGS